MEIVKFSLNHWSTEYHPDEEPFTTWMSDYHINDYLLNDTFVKENKLVVVYTFVDMSISVAVAAPKDFVEKNCPSLLYNDANKKFVFKPEDKHGLVGIDFQEYSEDNIGIWYYDQYTDELLYVEKAN